jgi:hypothetical protein
MSDGLDAMLGIIPTVVVAGITIKAFDYLTDAKRHQQRLRKKGIKTKLVKERGKYKLKKVI